MKRRIFNTALIPFLFLTVQCCKDKTPDDPEVNFDEVGMLKNISQNIIQPNYEEVTADAKAMNDAVMEFTTDVTSENLTSARDGWKKAVKSWQKVSIYQIGPAGDAALRDNVNLFPIDATLIEENIASNSYNLSTVSNYTAKGFQAIDYLLYGVGSNDSEILDKYSTDDLASNRKEYLKAVAGDLNSKISNVNSDWGTYASDFESNTGTDVGSSIGLLTNQMNLYYERFLRDGKVGIPAGARTFTQTPLPEKSECYYYNQNSTELLNTSLTSLKNLYLGVGADGTNGLGYDDYLSFNQDEVIHNSINAQFEKIETETSKLGESVATEVESNQNKMLSIFDDMQLLNNLLKVEMTNSLEVQITYSDTDGD